MKYCSIVSYSPRRDLIATALTDLALIVCTAGAAAATLAVPNNSFEWPEVPFVTPYASPEVEVWQKSEQPAWYDPSTNDYTPWAYLAGQFYNVPFPGQFIENCDGTQAAFLFALPEVALFQDYDSISGTRAAVRTASTPARA